MQKHEKKLQHHPPVLGGIRLISLVTFDRVTFPTEHVPPSECVVFVSTFALPPSVPERDFQQLQRPVSHSHIEEEGQKRYRAAYIELLATYCCKVPFVSLELVASVALIAHASDHSDRPCPITLEYRGGAVVPPFSYFKYSP